MKPRPRGSIYMPAHIAKAVDAITQKPLTFITAGAGFGKTTAVVNCLEAVPRTTLYHWYTCFGEPPARAWAGICRLLCFADERVGAYLSKLDEPTLENLGYIASLMEEVDCHKETILVIDNFHLAGFSAPYRLLNALAMHRSSRLHLVVLSQPLYSAEGASVLDPRVWRILQQTFCFLPQDIEQLFSLYGAPLLPGQAERLALVTEGWVAALRLHLDGWLAERSLSESVGMNELMERVFWQRLNRPQQELFAGLSLLDTFTEAQAARMTGRDVLPDEMWAAVYTNPFVRKSADQYTLHSLLKSFLAAKRQALAPALLLKLYGRAGVACQWQGRNVEAMLFFIVAGEDSNALSVPLTSLQLAEMVRNQAGPLETLLARCRTELLEQRWLLLLGTAVKASLNSQAALARTAVGRLQQLQALPGHGPHQRYAAAALEMVASFRAYNDIAQMARHHAAATALLDDPEDFYITNDSWTFCIPSVVYMFWRQTGALSDTVALLAQSLPCYTRLGGGKGEGAPALMAAEAHLLAGRLEESLQQAYLAQSLAQKAGQDSILFGVYTLLARVALLRGDVRGFSSAIEKIERHAFEGKEFLCLTAAEVALGTLYFLVDWPDKIPAWLCQPPLVRQTLYPISVPYVLVIALRHIRRHTPQAFMGTAQAYLQETDALHHLLPRVYFLLEEAAYHTDQTALPDGQEKALAKIALAMATALPDQVYLPFAEYYGALGRLYHHPSLCWPDPQALAAVDTLGRQFVAASAGMRAAMNGLSPLTPREREVALLAQQRASTKQIAQALHISPATVKNTLNKVYSKLQIAGKSDLEDLQF